jgi:hypothetical protein
MSGWTNFNPTNGNVVVSDTAITGYAWSANDGWINLSPTNGGVQNNTSGQLSGFAWDPTNGWINFQGVTIDSSGIFHGEATGVTASGDYNIINFDCANCRVVTTWLPTSTSTLVTATTTTTYVYVAPSSGHSGISGGRLPSYITTPVPIVEPPASQATPGIYPPSPIIYPQQSQQQGTGGGIIGAIKSLIPSWILPQSSTTTVTSPNPNQPPQTSPTAIATTTAQSQPFTVSPLEWAVGGGIVLVVIGIILLLFLL